ncbi:hypothetical protein VNO77_27735 [Canavalia gladiata]|uniref:Uncharacterized protein n=1 Tax=Canavalia gladiata TaxID=3824 RepID=A0AAN9KV88_CANGL
MTHVRFYSRRPESSSRRDYVQSPLVVGEDLMASYARTVMAERLWAGWGLINLKAALHSMGRFTLCPHGCRAGATQLLIMVEPSSSKALLAMVRILTLLPPGDFGDQEKTEAGLGRDSSRYGSWRSLLPMYRRLNRGIWVNLGQK